MTTVYIILGILCLFLVAAHWIYRTLNDCRPYGPTSRQIKKWRRDRVLMVAPTANRRRQ